MQRFVIKLAYNGFNYHGWQMQNNAHSIQSEITNKLSILLKQQISIVGCGRTDTGVHAREFFAHFDIDKLIWSEKELVYKLNSFLPADIAIYEIIAVDSDFNARFSALSRTYKYYINTVKDPFKRDVSFYYNGTLDVSEMNKACGFLIKHTDFTSFSKLHTQTATNNCDIEYAKFVTNKNDLTFTITANRFLRNMVRAIVGTLVEIGKGNLSAEDINSIIQAKDRGKAGFSVPAHALFLDNVNY